jgi:ATP-binding cassette subfamily B (MDR/TAP) protein 1
VTSRILVFEALKRWRQHKTTVVITHDLSQIESQDFVYVLKYGRVSEQGYRYDLEGVTAPQNGADSGEFRKMMDVQRATGGFLSQEDVDTNINKNGELESAFENDQKDDSRDKMSTYLKHQSIAIRPLTFGNWMFEVVADLTGAKPSIPVPPPVPSRESTYRVSWFVPAGKFAATSTERPRRPLSMHVPSSSTSLLASRRYSLSFMPTSTTFTVDDRSTVVLNGKHEEEEGVEGEKNTVKILGVTVRNGRGGGVRAHWVGDVRLGDIKVDGNGKHEKSDKESKTESTTNEDEQRPPFWALMRMVYPTIPGKPLLFFGLLI